LKLIKRIIFLFSFFLIYLIFKELLDLYSKIRLIHPLAVYVFFAVIAVFGFYFIIAPLYKILTLPRYPGPTEDVDREEQLIAERIRKFRKNKYLKSIHFDFSQIGSNREGYEKIIQVLKEKSRGIREKYTLQVFLSTSIAQNGFLDAILILSANVNVIKETFILYNGRTSYKDLLKIAKTVYYSVAIGGSEGAEYAANEILTKFGADFSKNIPFAGKIFESLVDGFVNSILLTRVALITENYCAMTLIRSSKDLYPHRKLIIETASCTTREVKNKIIEHVKKGAAGTMKDIASPLQPIKDMFNKIKKS
jgi:hypothetical protein